MSMHAEVKIIGLDTIQVALERAAAPYGVVSKARIQMVGHAANVGREILGKVFTDSAKGELRYNSPARPFYRQFRKDSKGNLVPRHRDSLDSGKSGYYDSRGPRRRLINYSLKDVHGVKRASLSSYPMNLWERNTRDGRPGLWIMTVRLAPLVASQMGRVTKKADEYVESEMERLMRGGGGS